MAVTATTAVWEGSSNRKCLLVLLALADHINEKALQAGKGAEAWPSQGTIAKKCNCSRSTVERALERLQLLDEIQDTGERRLRGTVVWEVLIDNLTQLDAGPYVEHPEGDLTHSADHLTQSDDDLTHSAHDLTHFALSPASPVTDKPEEPEDQPEVLIGNEHRSVSPSAAPDISVPQPTTTSNNSNSGDSPLSQLEALKAQLPDCHTKATREEIEDRIADIEFELREVAA